MKTERKVKSYTRRTKSGKTITVRSYTAKYDKKNGTLMKRGAGEEIEDIRKKKVATIPKKEAPFKVGFDDFAEWYEETGSTADKKVTKALRNHLGRSGYNKFKDFVLDNYRPRGYYKMFKIVNGITNKSLDEMTTPKKHVTISPKRKGLGYGVQDKNLR